MDDHTEPDIAAQRAREAERDALLSDLTSANHQLEGLLRIVSCTVGRLDMDHLFAEVLSALREVMGADAAMLFTVDGEYLALRMQQGYPDSVMAGFTLRRGEGFASMVAEAGTMLWTPDVKFTDSKLPIHDRLNMRAMFGMPLFVEGELYGVLQCAWSTERLVSDAERVMLQVASDRIVVAIAGARRFEGTTRERTLESAVARAAARLASSHEVRETVPDALEIMMEALRSDVALFGSFDGSRFEVLHACGMEPCVVDVPYHPKRTEAIYDTDFYVRLGPDSQAIDWLRETFGVSHALVVPVAVGGDMKAAVLFGIRDRSAGFDDLESSYGRRLSTSLALAYANARDYESEHRIAQTLQEALLTLDGRAEGVRFGHLYRSSTQATRVGGDFYDVFSLSHGRVGVLVGDVSGKGLEAAVLTTLVKHTIRAFAHESGSPADILRRSNEALAQTSRLRDFATVALAVIDPLTGEGVYTGAGHPPGLVLRGDGSLDSLFCGSPVLGAFAGLEFNECAMRLDHGDTLVLYTDGVTEARSSDGEFFGDERLTATLASACGMDTEEIIEALDAAIDGFTGGRLTDDVAVLALTLA